MLAALDQSLPLTFLVFALSATIIAYAGVALAKTADRLADQTGLGEAITGGVFLGASTSLSGFVTSVSTAAQGYADLALSNAVGGIAVQTLFLAVADLAYRRANLEHAAASITNLLQCTLLIALLSLPLLAVMSPRWAIAGVHPATLAIVIAYGLGIRLSAAIRKEPLWGPKRTPHTRIDEPEEPRGGGRELIALFARFLGLAVVIGVAGYAIGQAGVAISAASGLSQSFVGALFTATATSLPELVTTVAAVRRGALTLAVGGIVGGNTFDVLLVAASDIAYREGSIYHAAAMQSAFIIAVGILMAAVLLLGLLRREPHGVANIGFESAFLILIYFGAAMTLGLNG